MRLMMKRLLFIVLLTILSSPVFCQNDGALKFLGIPIDGTKAQFSSQLRAKGFTYNSLSEGYKGQFNGKDVEVFIHTNHNLVDRVYVSFPSTNEDGIRSEYNRLLSQFLKTDKYMHLGLNEEIPEDEDISYEISIHNKRYQASFSYYDSTRDKIAFMDDFIDELKDFYPKDQYTALKQFVKEYSKLSEDERDEVLDSLTKKMQEMELSQETTEDPERSFRFLAAFVNAFQSLADGSVWFMIHENLGRYNIGLYYDNLHNQAHGEDL